MHRTMFQTGSRFYWFKTTFDKKTFQKDAYSAMAKLAGKGWVSARGGCLPRVVSARGMSALWCMPWSVCLRGGCLPWGCTPPGPRGRHPSVDRILVKTLAFRKNMSHKAGYWDVVFVQSCGIMTSFRALEHVSENPQKRDTDWKVLLN